MALSQIQIIQSLAEALNWLEKEVEWGNDARELRQLVGRIGELYVALLTNGQMAQENNQRGYDVVSKNDERISVKTTAMTENNGHFSFNENTLNFVDRIVLVRVNTTDMEIEILFDDSIENARKLMTKDLNTGKLLITHGKVTKKIKKHSDSVIIKAVSFNDYIVEELENGSIEVKKDGNLVNPTKPILRDIAIKLNISLINQNGNEHTTRSLGTLVIKEVIEREKNLTTAST